jgi:ribosome maturation factor RimP
LETVDNQLNTLVKLVCDEEGIYLHHVGVHGSGSNLMIRVTVDTDEGIYLNECEKISRKISDMLFRKDIYRNGYNIEVTSPGANKPLEYPYEFRRNIGRKLKINYTVEEESRKIEGELKNYNEQNITLLVKKEEINIPLAQINQAKVKLKW